MSDEFDLSAWIDRELLRMYSEEVAKRFQEIMLGPRLAEMGDSMRKAQLGLEGFAKAFEGFTPKMGIWHVDEHPQQFTPAQFNDLWESFTHQRKVEYVLSLIT